MRIPESTVFTKHGVRPETLQDTTIPKHAAILVITNSTYAGTRAERACESMMQELKQQSIITEKVEFLPNDPRKVASRISYFKRQQNIDLIITTGGVFTSLKQDNKFERNTNEIWYDIRLPKS